MNFKLLLLNQITIFPSHLLPEETLLGDLEPSTQTELDFLMLETERISLQEETSLDLSTLSPEEPVDLVPLLDALRPLSIMLLLATSLTRLL